MWRLDRLKMSEWYSDGMGVVLGTYKRGRRWAGGMTNLATRERFGGHAWVREQRPARGAKCTTEWASEEGGRAGSSGGASAQHDTSMVWCLSRTSGDSQDSWVPSD